MLSNRIVAVLLGLPMLSLFTGCLARQELMQMQDNIAHLQDQIEQLKSEHEQQVAAADNKIGTFSRGMEALRTSNSDLTTRQDQLAQQISRIANKVEELADLTRRNQMQAEPYSSTPLPAGHLNSGALGFEEHAPGQPSNSTAEPITNEAGEKIYQAAYKDFIRGKYDLAIAGFEQYTKSFPQSELADNAQYWIGECFYTQGQFTEALQAFSKVNDNYSDGDKVPSALLKIAYCLIELDRQSEARNVFTDLVKRFPSSDEARLAREPLRDIQ